MQVFLLRVEEPDQAGRFTTLWNEPIPLKWRHAQAHTPKIVGHPVEADLAAFFRDAATSEGRPFLQLQTTYYPSRFNPFREGPRSHRLRLVLVARERKVESNYLTVEVCWDGEWPEGHETKPRGMVVDEVTASRPKAAA